LKKLSVPISHNSHSFVFAEMDDVPEIEDDAEAVEADEEEEEEQPPPPPPQTQQDKNTPTKNNMKKLLDIKP